MCQAPFAARGTSVLTILLCASCLVKVTASKELYEIVFDLATKANLPIEVAKLRGKLEQLEQEHAREIKQLEEKIKGLEAIVKQTSPPPSSERTKPAAADERMDKDDLSLDAQGC
jgi:hypothetical protein